MKPITTTEITATVAAYLRERAGQLYRIVQEMAVGETRADVALIGAQWIGIEIKSDSDTCKLLRHQALQYGRVFNFCSAVVTSKHLPSAESTLCQSWGLAVARRTERGNVYLDVQRPPLLRDGDAASLLALLWKDELVRTCKLLELDGKRWKSKGDLRQSLLDAGFDAPTLRPYVTAQLLSRKDWLTPAEVR